MRGSARPLQLMPLHAMLRRLGLPHRHPQHRLPRHWLPGVQHVHAVARAAQPAAVARCPHRLPLRPAGCPSRGWMPPAHCSFTSMLWRAWRKGLLGISRGR